MFSFSMNSETGEVGIKSEGPGLESGTRKTLRRRSRPRIRVIATSRLCRSRDLRHHSSLFTSSSPN